MSKHPCRQGIIYLFFKFIIRLIYFLNLVELFKYIANRNKSTKEEIKTSSNVAIDIFIIFKWIFVSILLGFNLNNSVLKTLLFYLIFMNAFTYFYYHLWEIPKDVMSYERQQRRYLSLILAILFSIYSFSIVYYQYYKDKFTDTLSYSNYLLFSFGASLTSYTGPLQVKPICTFLIPSIQLFLSFIMISSLLSSTTIEHSQKSNKE